MTKFKTNALKKTRKLFQKKNTEYDISSDSDTSVESAEYSHIPIPDLHLPLEGLTMEPQQNQASPLEGINQQLARMMQAIEGLTAKQAQFENQIQNANENRASSSGRANNANNRDVVSGDPFRIPDPIKILPSFNGNKKQLNSWLETAEKTLGLFQDIVPPHIYQIYLTAVSNKIEGHAKDVLCTNGNPTTFTDIKNILVAALGDKQELSTYNCQLWHNKMDGNVNSHYQKTKQLVYNIKSLAKQNPKYNEHWDAINDFIDEYSLAAYVSGLQRPYFGYVQAAEPKTIENAYAFLCKFTSNESNRNLTQVSITQSKTKNESKFSKSTGQENNYSHQKPNYSKSNNNQNQNPKPQRSETTERPAEPMDIGSVKSKLTLNKKINNHELNDSEEDDDDIDVNFTISPPEDPDE